MDQRPTLSIDQRNGLRNSAAGMATVGRGRTVWPVPIACRHIPSAAPHGRELRGRRTTGRPGIAPLFEAEEQLEPARIDSCRPSPLGLSLRTLAVRAEP